MSKNELPKDLNTNYVTFEKGDISSQGKRETVINSSPTTSNILFKILGVFICALLVASLFRNNFQPPLFTNLLQRLSSTPTITIPRINAEDWGIFEVLAQILNFITFLVSGAVNGLTVMFHTFGWLLGL